jgi:hypothetical protein
MIIDATTPHPSRDYVEMVYHFMKNRQEAQRFWRQFQRLGEEFTVADLDVTRSKEIAQKFDAQPRRCYYNAVMVAMSMSSGLDYMEGIATSILPTEHAWLVDRTWNRVIDPTWIGGHLRARKPAHKIKDYYGVRIPLALIREIVREQEVAGPMLWLCMDQLKDVKRRKRLVER